MAARRLPRGTRRDPVALGWEVERNVRDRLKAIASNMGVSAAVLIQHMEKHLELTDQGVPTWWEPLSSDNALVMSAGEENTQRDADNARVQRKAIGRPSKLNSAQLSELRRMREEDGASFAHIGRVFGVDRSTVSRAYADVRSG